MKNNRNKYVEVALMTNHLVRNMQETPSGAKYFRLPDGSLRRLNLKKSNKQTDRGLVRDLARAQLCHALGI